LQGLHDIEGRREGESQLSNRIAYSGPTEKAHITIDGGGAFPHELSERPVGNARNDLVGNFFMADADQTCTVIMDY